MALIEQPIFMVGAERSGTTLLRLMLDHHPEIAFHFEFEHAVDEVAAEGWPELSAYHRRLEIDRIFRHSGFRIDASLDYPHLVDSFLRQKQAQAGKRLIGATVHKHFDRLPRIWPDARFIHIVRDGRDVTRSAVRLGWAGNAWHGAHWWLEAEQTWDRLRPQLADGASIEVRYEELIRSTASVLERVCEFIGTEFSEKMLEYAETSSYDLPDPELLGQWKSADPREIRLIEGVIGDMLVARGYPLSGLPPVHPSALARRWLLLDSRARRARFRMRRYGAPLFLADLLARRLGVESWRRHTMLRIGNIDSTYLK